MWRDGQILEYQILNREANYTGKISITLQLQIYNCTKLNQT